MCIAKNNLPPGGAHFPSGVTLQGSDELRIRILSEVWNITIRLTGVTHAPNTSAAFVSIRMFARDFVVRNNFVVPIDDVEAVIWTEMNSNWSEPWVVTSQEVIEFGKLNFTIYLMLHADRLHFTGDGIGDEHGISPWSLESVCMIAGQGKAGKSGATHGEIGNRWREWRIGLHFFITNAWIRRTILKRDYRVFTVVGLLDKDVALRVKHQTPNIVKANTYGFKDRAIGAKASEFAIIKSNRWLVAGNNLRHIEGTLRESNPTTRHQGKLVRHEM